MAVQDIYKRQLRDLRISVTDRCNFRCRYCMPVEVFGPKYDYLPHAEILNFEEVVALAKVFVSRGVEKLRLTGGEPLLRRDLPVLIESLSKIEGVKDMAMTTNGVLLTKYAQDLKRAGLDRVTVSLDAMDEKVFAQMNGVGAKPAKVAAGIEAALAAGLRVKVNAVIQKGVNEQEVLPLARQCREWGVALRFIEFMDVGNENRWDLSQVFSAKETLEKLREEFDLEAVEGQDPTATARRWAYTDGQGEIGLIASVTQPFCRGCGRIRLSADGHLYTCLFANKGADVKSALRSGAFQEELSDFISKLWSKRDDRYSEERENLPLNQEKVSMSYIGG